MRNDFKLTPHFWFSEATTTKKRHLLSLNREKGRRRLHRLTLICEAMERIRSGALNNHPIDVHSMYRCEELNGQTAGSATRSQHIRAEACDWSPGGFDTRASVLEAFRETVAYLESEKIPFGQAIYEEIEGRFSRAFWIHLSLGYPFRPLYRCGQVLKSTKKGKERRKWEWVKRIEPANWIIGSGPR